MKKETPMKRLSLQFNRLNTLLVDSKIATKIELSKRDAKYNRHLTEPRKEIESDFIRIYSFSQTSIAFAFNYENGKDEIVVTVKDSNGEINGIHFTYDSFKLLFRTFIQSVESLQGLKLLNATNIISLTINTFNIQKLVLTESEIIDIVIDSVNEDILNVNKLKIESKKIREELDELDDKIYTEITKFKNKLDEQYSRKKIFESRRNAETEFHANMSELNNKIKLQLNNFNLNSVITKNIVKQIKNKINV